MRFLKKYWHLVLVSGVTLGLGILTLLTTQQLQQPAPITQPPPKAITPACTLTFSIRRRAAECEMCGGIAQIECLPGLICQLPPHSTMPDASGICVKPDGSSVCKASPTPTITPTPPPEVPNCANVTASNQTPLLGDAITLSADFSSPQGNLKGQIFYNAWSFTQIAIQSFKGNSGSISNASWTPPTVGTYNVCCRAWNDAIAECRPAALVDVPPRYACAGPNECIQIVVVTPTPTETATPTPTLPPGATYTPTPTLPPGATYTPTPTLPPGATYTPAPTLPPGATYTPAPTLPPGATYTPTPTQSLAFAPTETPTPVPGQPTAAASPTPKIPVSGVGPSTLGILVAAGGLLLLILGLAL